MLLMSCVCATAAAAAAAVVERSALSPRTTHGADGRSPLHDLAH